MPFIRRIHSVSLKTVQYWSLDKEGRLLHAQGWISLLKRTHACFRASMAYESGLCNLHCRSQ